jgi:hypothetical protein
LVRSAPPPPHPRDPPRHHEGGLASPYRHPVTRRCQCPRRGRCSRMPMRSRSMGHLSCLHDPTTTQGADPSPAAGPDTTCALDLGPQWQGVGEGGEGGGRANRAHGRRGTITSGDQATVCHLHHHRQARLTLPRRLLSPAWATATQGVD